MKISELKSTVTKLAADNKEALGEIGKLVGDLKKQIEDLVAGNADPDVTDAEFTSALNAAAADAAALAAIVPNPDAPPAEPPTGEPPPNPVV